jgi:two-component system C4-dicarboxylate transport sensor histidine kinase DctB
MYEVTTLGSIIVLALCLFYYSHREAKRSLVESRSSEKILTRDRDNLQKLLDKSNQELRKVRLAWWNELARAAEFGRLARGLFHDLMTPLSSLILHTEKIKETKAEQSIEKALQASQRMAVYIKDIRATLAKEESERICNCGDELESVLHFLAFPAKEKGVEIETSVERAEWFGSPTKLRQVFSNLITNAIDSFETIGEEHGKRIEIFIKRLGDTITLQVKDNGCGIPKELHHKIFEPFFTTKSEDRGTGIGLATVKTIVEHNLHGALTLDSERGHGTTISISFAEYNINPASYRPLRQTLPPLA